MTTFSTPVARLLTLALAVLFGVTTLAACDSTSSALTEETTDVAAAAPGTARLATALDLSAEQARQLDAALGGSDSREPGRLWTVAAELQQTLTDEQKARLLQSTDESGTPGRRFAGRDGVRGPNGRGRLQPRGDRAGRRSAPLLTDEQKTAAQGIRDRYRPQLQALQQRLRDGEGDATAVHEDMRSLREAMRDELHALLTDEQQAALQEKREERQATREERRTRLGEIRETAEAARAEALGLTDDQQAALDALRTKHREAASALREEIRSGALDRATARTRLETLRTSQRAEAAEVLTETQQEIVALHDALLRQAGRQRGMRLDGAAHRSKAPGRFGRRHP